MDNVTLRSPCGAGDASALYQIDADSAEADGIDDVSILDTHSSIESFTRLLTESSPNDWVIVELGGVVVGYGHTLWRWPERDGTMVNLHLGRIAPKWRGMGIGTQLIAALETRCRQIAQADSAQKWEFAANASQSETDSARLLTDCGYVVAFTILEMGLDHDGAPGEIPTLPDGYDLRTVLPEHTRAIWQCIGDAYDADGSDGRYRPVSGEDSFRRYFESGSADPDLWFVAWHGSRIAGQALARIEGNRGEIYEVSVGLAHRRRGLARALTVRAIHALSARGVGNIRIFTSQQNPQYSWRLYESVGFQTVKTFPRWRKPPQ